VSRPSNRVPFIWNNAKCPSLVLNVSASRFDVRHFPVADLPAVAQAFDSSTQLAVAAHQRPAGEGRGRPRHTRDGRQDVDDGLPSSVDLFAVAFRRRDAPVTARAEPGRLSGSAEYGLAAQCRRKLALVPLSNHQQTRFTP